MPAHYGIFCLSKGRPRIPPNLNDKITRQSIYTENASLKKWYCSRATCLKKRNGYELTDREPLTNLWWDIHRLKHNSRRVDHPCQLPPALMRRIIHLYTHEDEMVLDPFNGAGTTSLVATMLNRNYIGIELSGKYHRIATERHIELENGLNPFRKLAETPKSKNSRVARLSKQKYEVPKKVLQLDVQRIAITINRKPSRDDVLAYSKYPIKYFDDYFIDWGEVCAAVGDKGMNEDPLRAKKKDTDHQLKLPI